MRIEVQWKLDVVSDYTKMPKLIYEGGIGHVSGFPVGSQVQYVLRLGV